MDTLIYEPIRDDLDYPATRADLDNLYEKLQNFYGREKEPPDIILLDD